MLNLAVLRKPLATAWYSAESGCSSTFLNVSPSIGSQFTFSLPPPVGASSTDPRCLRPSSCQALFASCMDHWTQRASRASSLSWMSWQSPFWMAPLISSTTPNTSSFRPVSTHTSLLDPARLLAAFPAWLPFPPSCLLYSRLIPKALTLACTASSSLPSSRDRSSTSTSLSISRFCRIPRRALPTVPMASAPQPITLTTAGGGFEEAQVLS
ncbi:hypothetical protein EYF80_050966 [Liparis tanakae]|uniref:Uncharacterized protein n=1 Tax=Liparis tanakae TaxID=230148 RepID=A0A4Z2FD31_9TELE|nr:hypothetical protein EYF80_050966 [Liparis tanakae]